MLARALTPPASMTARLEKAATHLELRVRPREVGQRLGGGDQVVTAEGDCGGTVEHLPDGAATGAFGGDAAERVLDHPEARAAVAQLGRAAR